MAAASAFCVFRLYPTPSDFNSTNFLPSLRSIQTQTTGQKHRCNNSLQHKLAAKLYFESSSAKKEKKKRKKKSTDHALHNTFRSHLRELWCDLTAHTNMSSGWLRPKRPLHCIICEWGKTRVLHFVTSQNDAGHAEKFSGNEEILPFGSQNDETSGSFRGTFFSSSNRTPKFDFSEFVRSLPDMSTPLAADASLVVRYINIAVCPTDTFIRHHARAGSQFANALISHNAFMWLASRQLAHLSG